jgi:hypothetical protein
MGPWSLPDTPSHGAGPPPLATITWCLARNEHYASGET